jgi:PIN domain nuclease of toxin-antitoxin system
MRLLLDTHAFLWWVEDDSRLSVDARACIADGTNECHVSVASAWEMAIKCSLGKLKLGRLVHDYFARHLPANGFRLLPVEIREATDVECLAFYHRDPFDRLLIAQAQRHGLDLVFCDRMFDRYGIARIW